MNATNNNVILKVKKIDRSDIILMPDKTSGETEFGEVISVGPDCNYGIGIGQTVVFGRDDGRECGGSVIISEERIYAIIND
jgi:co-chaperonin GroES (HSP10)